MVVKWSEIKRFLNDYKWFNLIGVVIIAAVLGLAMTYLDSNSGTGSETEGSGENSEYLESTPAYFQFYAENEDGEQFNNVGIIRQYFNLDDVKENASQETGVDLLNIEETINNEYNLEDDQEFSTVNLSRNTNNNLFTISFNTGNESDNLAVAEHYYQLIQNNEISFLENKNIFDFVSPTLAEEQEEAENEEASANTQNTTGIILSLVRNIIVGLVIGFVLMLGISLLRALFGKRINYSFSYDIGEKDEYFLYNPAINSGQKLSQFVGIPFAEEKLVLHENSLTNEDKELLSTNKDIAFSTDETVQTKLTETNTLIDVDIKNNYSEIILIVKPYKTTRDWYTTQRKFVDLIDVPVKVIQLNHDNK